MDHYANAFTITPGRCFRMVQLPGVGQPMYGVKLHPFLGFRMIRSTV